MIKILRLKDFSAPVEKNLIPSQLDSHWAKILDSDTRTSYVGIIEKNGIITEQLNFCIMNTSFGNFFVSMPYIGYGSCLDVVNKQDIKELFVKLEEFAKEKNCLNMSICTHPLSSMSFEDYKDVFDYAYSHKKDCQISVLDNGHPLDNMTHKRRSAFKNEISKIEQSDYFIDKKPDRKMFDQWYEVYKKRFEDVGGICNTKEFFLGCYEISKNSDTMDFWVIRNESEVLGGVICEIGKNIVDYTTSAFSTESRKLYPTTYLLNEYLYKAIEQKIRYFNWQGSGVYKGILEYKKRWGAGDYEQFYFAKNLVPISEITATPLSKVQHELVRCYVLPYSLWEDTK